MIFWEVFYHLCENNNKTPNAVCKELNLSNATATHWKNGTMPKGDVLSNIADYFNVSTDYLLGRTDQPNGFINNENGFKSINVNGSVGNNSINNNYAELDKHDRELLEEYNKLSLKNKAKVINLITELEENNG